MHWTMSKLFRYRENAMNTSLREQTDVESISLGHFQANKRKSTSSFDVIVCCDYIGQFVFTGKSQKEEKWRKKKKENEKIKFGKHCWPLLVSEHFKQFDDITFCRWTKRWSNRPTIYSTLWSKLPQSNQWNDAFYLVFRNFLTSIINAVDRAVFQCNSILDWSDGADKTSMNKRQGHKHLHPSVRHNRNFTDDFFL